MRTSYNKIVNEEMVATHGPKNFAEVADLAWSERTSFANAQYDKIKVLMVCIDFQNDFMEDIGALPVAHSKDDVRRTARWLYSNGSKVTKVFYSLDTHTMKQIFHPCWWRDQKGNLVTPGTVITYEDMVNGIWIPNFDKKIQDENNPKKKVSYCQEYLRHLKEDGKKELRIWNYHCLEGTFGADLEGELAKMIYFHSILRSSDPIAVRKGTDPWTEMYGIINPEWSLDGYINKQVLRIFSQYDIIIFTGEAASHCVGDSLVQTLWNFRDRPDITKRFVVFKDCMSPIPGFEDYTEGLLYGLQQKYGITVTNSTDFML